MHKILKANSTKIATAMKYTMNGCHVSGISLLETIIPIFKMYFGPKSQELEVCLKLKLCIQMRINYRICTQGLSS